MQNQFGAAAEAAIVASERRIRAKVLIDWNDNGLFNHPLSDVSEMVSEISTDQSLTGSAPSELLLIEGSAAAELNLSLQGEALGYPMSVHLSPYNPDSALYGKRQVGVEIKYSIIVDGSVGSYEYPQFIGNIRSISPDRASNKVAVTALDRAEKLRRSIQLPAWAVSYETQGFNEETAAVCRSHWVIDNCLRLCDAGAGPKRPTFREELSGPPLPNEGPQFFLTGNGAYLPTVGRSENYWANSFPSAGTDMYVDAGPLHPSAPSGSQRPQALAGLGLPVSDTRGVRSAQGILKWWVADRDGINPYGTHYLGFTLNMNGPNSQAYKTIAQHDVLEVKVGDGFELQIQVKSGQVRSAFVNFNTSTTINSSWLTIPDTGFNVDIFSQWDLTSNAGTRCYLSAGNVNNNWESLGSPPALGSAVTDAGRIRLEQALSVSDVFYAARNWYGAGENPNEAWEPVKYPAVLDKGKNRFSYMPSAKPQEAWKAICEVAAAELGAVFWDETGTFRFWNSDTVLSKQNTVVRSLSLDDVSGLSITNTLDSVRNEYAVQASDKRAAGVVAVYKSSDINEFYVPALTSRKFRLWVDDVMSPWTLVLIKYLSDSSVNPAFPQWSDLVTAGYCTQHYISGVWQERSNLGQIDVRAYFTLDGYLTINIWNGFDSDVRLAKGNMNNADGNDQNSQPAFALGGSKIISGAPQTLWTRNTGSILKYGPRTLSLTGDWYQSSVESLSMISALANRTGEPTPTTDAIEIAGDPRIQLGDTVQVDDPAGVGSGIRLQVLGVNRTFSVTSGLTDSLTVEMVQPGGPVIPPPDDGGGGSGLRTNLLVNPDAADNTDTGYSGPAGSAFVTGLTGMPRTTGYSISGVTSDGLFPVGNVDQGETYTFSAFVRSAGSAAINGTAHIAWYTSGLTALPISSPVSWSAVAGSVLRVDTGPQVSPAGAVKARLVLQTIGAMTMTAGLYEMSSELLPYFDANTPGAILNSDGTSSLPEGAGGGGGSGAVTFTDPGQCLNIGPDPGMNHFNVGIGDATMVDHSQSEIYGGFSSPDNFSLNADKTEVEFRADMDDATTSGSAYPRSELRELDQNGTSLASWNGASGMHYLEGVSTGRHFHPTKDQKAVFAQIHDSSSDLVRVQFETTGGKLGIVCRNSPPGGGSEIKKVVMSEYTVGTPVSWRLEANNGAGKLFLNGVQVQAFDANTSGCYFKAGCYAQSNETYDVATEYDIVSLHSLVQWHTGWPAPIPPKNAGPSDPGGGTGGGADGTTAAVTHGWGSPLPLSDEFNYTGSPDNARWSVYGKGGSTGGAECWVGHDGNGRRCFNNAYVNGQYMRITGESDGDTTGVASRENRTYGRWEIRARFLPKAGATGNPYHPVGIIWSDDSSWPTAGEYDFIEVDIGDTGVEAFLHYPHPSGVPTQQENPSKSSVDITDWHNYGFEWTSSGLKGYLDGVQWFSYSGGGGPEGRSDIQDMPSGHLTLQLDNFFGSSGMQEAYMDVEWARVYDLSGSGSTGGGTPGSKFDLTPWKLGLPTDGSDSGSESDEVKQPALDTYTDSNFYLDSSNRMVCNAPVQGATTSGSGGTRTELREMQSGTEADYPLSSPEKHELTVTGVFDPTGSTDRKEMIIGQVHGSGGTPPMYLAVEHHVSPPRLRVYKNGPGLANILTGLTATTEITYRIRVQSGRVKLWAAIGKVADLPSTPQYDWPASDFSDNTGCYLKAGAYNKSTVSSGGSGGVVSKISFLELIQGSNVYTSS